MYKGLGLSLIAVVACLAAPSVFAQSTRITEDRPSFSFSLNGETIQILRSGPQCPPNCVQPMLAAPGLGTIGELEVIDFLDLFVSQGNGLLVDVRLPGGFAQGTLPGAVNLPAQTLRADNPYRNELFEALGARNGAFNGAFDLVVFGAGPDDGDAPMALKRLLDAGYPATKLKYYRGGLNSWRALGLTTASGS